MKILNYLIIFCFLSLLPFILFGENEKEKSKTGVFIRNDGQLVDMNGELRDEFLYYLPGDGLDVYFRKTGITYILKESELPYSMLNALPVAIEDSIKKFKESEIYFYRFDMDFVDASEKVSLKGYGKDDFYKN